MKYKLHLFIALLLLGTIIHHNGHAQTKDSLEQNVATPPPSSTTDQAIFFDTVLTRHDQEYNPDIIKWKRSREFSYMRYLDSLLKTQKDMRTDTVSVDENSGRIKRRHSASTPPSSFNTVLNSWPLKIFFWLMAAVFIVVIFYKLIFKNQIFSRKKEVRRTEEEQSVQELNELSEYDLLINEAESKNEFNLATRYLFLKTIKNLSEKNCISFTPEKTNKDYLNEMRRHNYFDEFAKLTRDYEYVWYGKFLIGETQYQQLKEAFAFFNQKV
jgi:hypothetical protein